MKIAVVGKGGVGKTTVSAAIATTLARAGETVYAIDADPNNCLGYALGLPEALLAQIKPLSDMTDLLAERAGVQPGAGGMFTLTPQVNDLIEEYTIAHDHIRLLVMGTVEAGGGCVCPESNVLRALVRELVDLPHPVILDMEAGVEHLGRGTARAVHGMVVVVNPAASTLRTARRIAELAAGLGVPRIVALANRVTSDAELAEIAGGLGETPIVGHLPAYAELASEQTPASPGGQRLLQDIGPIVAALQARLEGSEA